jgi:hypothetical protein
MNKSRVVVVQAYVGVFKLENGQYSQKAHGRYSKNYCFHVRADRARKLRNPRIVVDILHGFMKGPESGIVPGKCPWGE